MFNNLESHFYIGIYPVAPPSTDAQMSRRVGTYFIQALTFLVQSMQGSIYALSAIIILQTLK